MTIRHGLLAMLAQSPTHGYGLKSRFEECTAGTWRLNIGQVYTTLQRLHRDGLIEMETTAEGVDTTQRGNPWTINEAGLEQLRRWYRTPVHDEPARDELTIKVLLAIADPDTDPTEVIHQQRRATMTKLQRFTRQKAESSTGDLPWTLLLDAFILEADAEARWLDLCEERLRSQEAS